MTRPRIAVYSIFRDEAKHVDRWCATTADADVRVVVVDHASTDGTLGLLHAHHVDAYEVNYGEMGGFRFDTARNYALDHVPADVDLCISLDADELLDDGFIEGLRLLWDRQGPFNKAHPWFNTGNWWRADRVHSRHGWVWRWPCHELTDWVGDDMTGPRHVDYEGIMRHSPDNTKKRANYLPLLRVAVEEEPDNGRMWTYLARQLFFDGGDYAETAHAIDKALEFGLAINERAYMLRIRATIEATEWLRRSTETGEPESWHAYATQLFTTGNYEAAAAAAARAHAPSHASHYLTDQAARAWGSADLAARSHWALGRHAEASAWGVKAWLGNVLDGRLAANVAQYVAAAGVPTFAVIAAAPDWRDDTDRAAVTDALISALEKQGARVLFDDTDRALHVKWNARLAQAAELASGDGRDEWNVLVINDDVRVDAGVVSLMAAALRSDGDVGAVCPDGEDFAGWCHMLRGEQGYRYDERFGWWYGDSDMHMTLLADGMRVVHVPVSVEHLHANVSTFSSPERMEQARLDERLFADKWLDGDDSTLFFARSNTTDSR